MILVCPIPYLDTPACHEADACEDDDDDDDDFFFCRQVTCCSSHLDAPKPFLRKWFTYVSFE